MPKRATRKGVTPAKRSPKRKPKPTPRAATKPEESRGPGRPSLYRTEYCQSIIDYFAFKDVEYQVVGEGKNTAVVKKVPELPTFAGFADSIGVHRQTLHEWCEAHPEFSDAYARARDRLERMIWKHGLAGDYASQMAQFFLKSRLGVEEIDTLAIIGGKPGQPPVQSEATLKVDEETAGALARLTLRMKTAGGQATPR